MQTCIRPLPCCVSLARIKNSESLIVPEVGHSTYWEQPDVFNQQVLEFIRKH